MKYTLEITGNQENLEGNPIPYVRMTQAGKYVRENALRYGEWKEFVRSRFLDAVDTADQNRFAIVNNVMLTGKPLSVPKREKTRVDVFITYRGRKGGDPDNIWKGIVDALFKTDRRGPGGHDYKVVDDGPGAVIINIEIPKQ